MNVVGDLLIQRCRGLTLLYMAKLVAGTGTASAGLSTSYYFIFMASAYCGPGRIASQALAGRFPMFSAYRSLCLRTPNSFVVNGEHALHLNSCHCLHHFLWLSPVVWRPLVDFDHILSAMAGRLCLGQISPKNSVFLCSHEIGRGRDTSLFTFLRTAGAASNERQIIRSLWPLTPCDIGPKDADVFRTCNNLGALQSGYRVRVGQSEPVPISERITYYCWNRNPSSRYPKKANKGARPKCRVMRKIRKRLRTGR